MIFVNKRCQRLPGDKFQVGEEASRRVQESARLEGECERVVVGMEASKEWLRVY